MSEVSQKLTHNYPIGETKVILISYETFKVQRSVCVEN